MSKTINFGIDLGTTNSAVAKFEGGEVKIFNNPLDYGRSTLPSVVEYKNNKTIVGSKAKEGKTPTSLFKRKMGTNEKVNGKTPVELSAAVLKELKGFVTVTGDAIPSAVITIPSAFDTIQSNATLEAGKQAGFTDVVLLQEPIAASLAYANQGLSVDKGKWLVYDLGGGTFDVALLEINDGEMKVLDHKGNNFQGGADYDSMILEKLIIPKVEEALNTTGLIKALKNKSGKYHSKYQRLLNIAEGVKIELSNSTSTDVYVDDVFFPGTDLDLEITITKADFDALVKPSVEETIGMIHEIMNSNSLTSKDLEFILMVGGSTFIPQVRERIAESLKIAVKTDIDPTTAVAVGAAYYAATKESSVKAASTKKYKLEVKTSYDQASRDNEILLAVQIKGDVKGLSYRITRKDGAFDSGINEVSNPFTVLLPLIKDEYNYFNLNITNEQGDVVYSDELGVNSGFHIKGQPIPEDICLEIDDLDGGDTKLDLVFQKNTILPTKTKKSFPINKTLLKGAIDNVLYIKLWEGTYGSLPSSNKNIGIIKVSGDQLDRDLTPGSMIDFTFSMDESRTLTVDAYFVQADQEITKNFNPKERDVNVDDLKDEVSNLYNKIDEEIEAAEEREDYETAGKLKAIKEEASNVAEQSNDISTDDSTDDKFKIEDKKRAIAQKIDSATKDKQWIEALASYTEQKDDTNEAVENHGNNMERKQYSKIVAREDQHIKAQSILGIKGLDDELHGIYITIQWRNPDFLAGLLKHLSGQKHRMNDQEAATAQLRRGMDAYQSGETTILAQCCRELFGLLPAGATKALSTKIGFGG